MALSYTDQNVDLVLNRLTKQQYDALVASHQINEDQLYLIDDDGLDTSMSDSSTNAVQNRVIKAYVDTQVTVDIDEIMNTEYGGILQTQY